VAQARIVRMMMDYELKTAEQGKGSLLPGSMGRWARRYKRRMENKMVAIGDGADLYQLGDASSQSDASSSAPHADVQYMIYIYMHVRM